MSDLPYTLSDDIAILQSVSDGFANSIIEIISAMLYDMGYNFDRDQFLSESEDQVLDLVKSAMFFGANMTIEDVRAVAASGYF